MENNKYSFPTSATPNYWPTDQRKTPDLLDFFVSCGISKSYLDITASYDISSDHTPIRVTESLSLISNPYPSYTIGKLTGMPRRKLFNTI